MSKDWTGNSKSIYATLGASNHASHERQVDDFYATDPSAVEKLLELEHFNEDILEPCCGLGHISEVLMSNGYNVTNNDLVQRDYPLDTQLDFLKDINAWHGDIITNPPYKYAKEFVEHSLDITRKGAKIAMFLKLQFLEGQARRKLFDKHCLRTVYVSSSRIRCGMNGVFEGTSAVAYAWFIWENGYKGYPEIRWFN